MTPSPITPGRRPLTGRRPRCGGVLRRLLSFDPIVVHRTAPRPDQVSSRAATFDRMALGAPAQHAAGEVGDIAEPRLAQ